MSKRKVKNSDVTVWPTGVLDMEHGSMCGHRPTLADYDLQVDRDSWVSLIHNAGAWQALRFTYRMRRVYQ